MPLSDYFVPLVTTFNESEHAIREKEDEKEQRGQDIKSHPTHEPDRQTVMAIVCCRSNSHIYESWSSTFQDATKAGKYLEVCLFG